MATNKIKVYGKSKKYLLTSGVGGIAIILLVVLLLNMLFKNSQQINNTYNPELARAMEYQKVNDGDDGETGSEYVKFDAFFLRDLDNDGYADKIRGTCREINATDTLYINLNVLTNGTLQNGKIEIQGQNINFKTAIVEDDVIKENYISENTTTISLKNVEKGTQKLIYGTVKALTLGADTKKYSSEENKIILTGIHVTEDGQTQTPIRKEVRFTVDWYASVSCSIYDYTGRRTGIQDIEKIRDEENRSINLSFYIETKEEKELAILQSSYLTGTIPPLNGYMPTKVEITGTDITSHYEQKTGFFEAKRVAELNESKIVTKKVPRNNTYRFNVIYPIEAYEEMDSNTISIQVPLQAYYEGYNNENDEFEHPVKSNIVTKTLSFLWRRLDGNTAIIDVKVGNYRKYYKNSAEYIVSKEKPLNMYNRISENEVEDFYTVKWDAYTGIEENIYSIQMQEPTENIDKDEDRFLDSENQFHDMSGFAKNVGIYFTGADTILGEDGKIEVYDTSENKLIHTFTSADWNTYNSENPYMYKEPITHIKVETSKLNKNSNLTVYNIKEINDSILLETFKNKEQFDKLQNIYSYVKGRIKTEEEGEYVDINIDEHFAIYEAPISVASVEVEKDTYGTQKEEKQVNIIIKTTSSYYNMEEWANGRFLVELPKEVLDIKINNVTSSDGNINILAYGVHEIEGQKFIQIETENEIPTTYSIVVNCDLTADPRITTKSGKLKLYAINENCENYKYSEQDAYDIDKDSNTIEQVCYAEKDMYFVSPSSLLTNQQATEYNQKGETAVAPQIATIDKTEVDTAKIKISLTNNYGSTVSEVKIVGKIPTKENTFIINKSKLGSNFNTTMEGKIEVPAELENYVTVYYSDREDITGDLTDEKNNWNENLDPAQAKSYLIDLGEYSLDVNEQLEFSYEIKLPDTVQYNDISYSTHAVYYCLDTDGGKFKTEIETSKLGFRIERKYNLNLKKLKEKTETPVQGAVFAIIEVTEDEGESIKEGKLGTTNAEGMFTIEDLYVDKTYILKEIRTPSSYEKNTTEYKFKVTVATDELQLQDLSEGKKLESAEITQPTDGSRGILNVKVENTPKYQIVLTKKEQDTGTPIPGVRYNLKGGNLENEGITIVTDKEGKLTISELSRETEYTLTEVSAVGYYLMETPIIFKMTNEDGTVKFKTTQGEFVKTSEVTIGDGVTGINAQDKVEVELEDEKVPTYSITLKKYAKDKQDITLRGAQYKIEGEGIKEGGEIYTTGEEGTLIVEGLITINGLYEYVEEKPQVTGVYTITEITPPEGYSLNATSLQFRAERKRNNNLEIHIIKGRELIRLVPDIEDMSGFTKQDITITNADNANANIQIGLVDEPLFKLTKTEKETKTPIPNTKFKLIEIDEEYNEIGPAKDINEKEVGEEEKINGKIERVVTTDEKGIISYGLKSGLYKAVEVQSADGYIFPENEEQRTYYFGVDESKKQETEQDVTWSNEVASNRWNKVDSVYKTKDKGIVIAGYFTGKLDLDGDEKADLTGEDKAYSGFIAKYTEDGKLNFAKNITCTNEVKATNVIQTQDGGYIIIGDYNGANLKIGQVDTGLKDITGYKKGFVIKFLEDGTYSWGKEIVDENKDVNAVCVVEDTNGDIIVGANTNENGNPKIVEYSQQGEEQYETEIPSGVYIEDMVTSLTNNAIIVISSTKEVTTSSTTGRIDTYQNGSVTPNATVDFNPSAITRLATGKYVIVGNYMGTAQGVQTSEEYYDGIIVDYDGNSVSNPRFVKGNSDDMITAVEATSDEGFIVGTYTHSNALDFDNRNEDIAKEMLNISGNTDALIIKYDRTGNYESYKQIQGTNMEQITDIAERKENEYVVVGYFNSKTVSAYKPEKDETNLKLSQYTDGFVLNYGEKVVAPEIPEKSEIEVENELKSYIITTEIKLLEGQKEAGGTITGGTLSGEDRNPVETVKHGKNSITTIEIEPKDKYKIVSITINDENYAFTPDNTGKVIMPQFKNMTSNKHIVVTFSNTASSIIVHHYLDGTESNPEPTQIAPDEIKVGEIGKKYTTEPYTQSDQYELKRNEEGEFILPYNKSGDFEADIQQVTYLYIEKKVPLIVHHYLEGTETHVEKADGSLAEDMMAWETAGTSYTTEPLKPYNDETEQNANKKLAEKYELTKTPINAEGTYKYPKVEVTYEYKVKTYNVITKVKTHVEKDEYGQEQEVKGGKILGEDVSVYETVEHGQNNTQTITATPEENYKVKSITLNERELQKDEDYTLDEATGSITLHTITNIKEDQTIEVEFEKIQTLVVVNHYIYDKKTGTKTQNPVPLSTGHNAEREESYGPIGEMYVTKAKEDILEGYELYEEPGNSSGYREKDPIYVNYYYAIKDADIIHAVTKDGTQIITSKDEEINYTIGYTATIKQYEGNATVTIVDTLPYALDKDKMKEIAESKGIETTNGEEWLKTLLAGGTYEEKAGSEEDIAQGNNMIYTITWVEQENQINTTSSDEELPQEPTITINKEITVVFKGISTKEPPEGEENIFTNKVKATIQLDATSQEVETQEVTHDTKTNFIKNIKVTKTWNHKENIYERPTKVTLQLKIEGQDEVIASHIVSAENSWTHTFTGLKKYDDAGNEIEYTVDEAEVDGESLQYYEKTLN